MIAALLTFPARATARAIGAALATEPLPTITFGPRDDIDPYVSTTCPPPPPARPAPRERAWCV